jgi:hypothetical protein
MSIEIRGGCWCVNEDKPVAAERNVPDRGLLAIVLNEPAQPEPWHCRDCGGPIRLAGVGEDWEVAPIARVPAWRQLDRERLDADRG